jgi:HEAT repeat protein
VEQFIEALPDPIPWAKGCRQAIFRGFNAPILIKTLEETSIPRVKAEILELFKVRNTHAARHAVLNALFDPNERVREKAARASIVLARPEDAPHLIAAFNYLPNADCQHFLVVAVARLRAPDAVTFLLGLLDDLFLRKEAERGLRRLGRTERAPKYMTKAEIETVILDENQPSQAAFFRLEQEARTVDLIDLLKHSSDKRIRISICITLWNRPRRLARVRAALVDALTDSEWSVRQEAADALGFIVTKAEGPALVRAYRRERSRGVRAQLAYALAKSRYEDGVPILLRVLADPENVMRADVAKLLGDYDGIEIVEAMERVVATEEDSYSKQMMLQSLARIRNRQAQKDNVDT